MADVSGTLKLLDRRRRDIFDRAVDNMNRQLGRSVPVDKGVMARSRTFSGVQHGPTVSRATIGYPGDIPGYTDKGTRRHVIRPKRPGGVLAFRVGGRQIFTKVVHHPGTKGTKWWSNVMRISNWKATLKKSL